MRKLIITAGHSLKQGGASGNGDKEELLTIEIRDLLVEALENQRPELVVWTDNDNDSLSTVIAKTKAIATKDDILLDIHFNSASNKSVEGAESFVAVNARGKSVRVAERLTELVAGMLKTPNRGVKLENKSQHSRLGILHSAASSILLEVQFISKKEAMENYHDMKKRLAIGMANILVQELES